MNLTSSGFSVVMALIFRTLGLAVITVPLTMVAVSTLPQKDIPQGAALNNMMRQLGESFGLAMVSTPAYTLCRASGGYCISYDYGESHSC